MKFYTYIYLDPRYQGRYECHRICFLFKPFYVGKGSNDRWQSHIRDSSLAMGYNPKKERLIRKLKKTWNLREYVVRIPCETEEESLKLEQELISEIGLKKLTNLTDGGIGMSGYKHSEEHKKKMSIINSKPKPNGFGEKVSNTKKGVPLTEEHKAALRGRTFSEEHKQKLRDAKLGKPRWQKSNQSN